MCHLLEAGCTASIMLVNCLPYAGPWMEAFGLGDAAKHIGTPQSIALRNPDCAVATHLMNLVRPEERSSRVKTTLRAVMSADAVTCNLRRWDRLL